MPSSYSRGHYVPIVVHVLYMGSPVNIRKLNNKHNTINKHMGIEKQTFGC